MPNINTLVDDIDTLLSAPSGQKLADEIGIKVGLQVGRKVRGSLNREDRARRPKILFPSEIGHPCARKTWYDFNYDPASMIPAETLQSKTKIKFLYGDIIEAMIIPLVEATGHAVEYVDHKITFPIPGTDWSLSGKIDMMIDGVTVDVKSMGGFAFNKYDREGVSPTTDQFGYTDQINAYRLALDSKAQGAILGINKELGDIGVFFVPADNNSTILKMQRKVQAVETLGPKTPRLVPIPEGKSGNMKIPMPCSYCKYKYECWQDSNGGRGLRGFYYASGPVFLAEVVNEPKVPEIKGPV